MSFVEIRLPSDCSRGARGGPRWNNKVIQAASGREQVFSLWSKPIRQWDVSHTLRNNTKRNKLNAFHQAMRGRVHGFRFKDWTDFQLNPTSMVMVGGNPLTWQIVKTYSIGGQTITRNLTKPVLGTTRIWEADGTTEILTDWTVCITSGIVTFAFDPLMTPKASCEFDVPARFDTDDYDFEQAEARWGNWSSIPIIEIDHSSNVCAYAAGADRGPHDDGTSDGTGGGTNGNPGGGGSGVPGVGEPTGSGNGTCIYFGGSF